MALRKWPPPPPENKPRNMSEEISLKSKRNLWVKIYCEALRSPKTPDSSFNGENIRNFATKCANRALEEVSKIG